jgi:hypothetical protein
MYDQGSAANALGAYGGERAPTARPVVSATGLHHLDRNALYVARGPYYLRVIGSDESAAVTEKLAALAETLAAGIPGEPLPWAYGLFIGQMGLDPGALTYFSENAFSFGFAKDVWSARPGGRDSDLELFVSARADAKGARALAEQLRKGFAALATPAGKLGGVPVLKDEFLGTLTAVTAHDRFTVGVRGAATEEALAQELGKITKALAGAPEALKARAVPGAESGKAAEGARPATPPPAAAPEGDYGEQ